MATIFGGGGAGEVESWQKNQIGRKEDLLKEQNENRVPEVPLKFTFTITW